LKPSPIGGAFSSLNPNLLILSLVNKFDVIALEFGPKRMQSQKKSLRIKFF
jgi:hypothetical protein